MTTLLFRLHHHTLGILLSHSESKSEHMLAPSYASCPGNHRLGSIPPLPSALRGFCLPLNFTDLSENVTFTDFMSAYSFVIFHSPYRYFNQLLLLYLPYLIREFKAKLPYWAFLGLIGFSRLPLLGFFPTGASIMATRSPVPYSSIWWHTTQSCWGFPSSPSAYH